jgi:Glycosyl hydrolases family 2, sugar binding domain
VTDRWPNQSRDTCAVHTHFIKLPESKCQMSWHIQVMKWSDGSYLEDQDMWCLSGIFRNVYVLMQPKASHIADYQIRTPMTFDKDGALQSLELNVGVDVSAQVRANMFHPTQADLKTYRSARTMHSRTLVDQASVDLFDPLFVAFAYIRLTCALRCSCRAMMGAFQFRHNPVDTAYMVKASCHLHVWLCLVPVSAPHKEDK